MTSSDANRWVRYRDGLETIADDEESMIEQILASMARANVAVADKHRHGLRDAHAKSHGIVRGELRVHADAPEAYRQGLFARAAVFPVIVRFSSAPGDLRSDRLRAPHGMAVKVLHVEGERAVDDGADTQDFLLVNSPTLPFGTLDRYLKLQKILEAQPSLSDNQMDRQSRNARALAAILKAAGRDLPVPLEIASLKDSYILSDTFHSMAALRHGDFVAKISAKPLTPQLQPNAGWRAAGGDSAIRADIERFFSDGAADYDVRAQLCADVDTMPIEDASVLWREASSPHVSVATLHLPSQSTYSSARRVYADDVLSFSPWHAMAAHRPLGAIMRARAKAYPKSSDFRHRYNHVDSHEPTSINELPD